MASLFDGNVVSVICADGTLIVPQFLIDKWETFKGLLDVDPRLNLDHPKSLVETLLKYQLYFETALITGKTKINSDAPFNKQPLLNLTIDVYKLAHFVGIMNIVEFVTANIFFMPNLELINNFFQEWNHDQIAKIEFGDDIYLEKLITTYDNGATYLEDILKNVLLKQLAENDFALPCQWKYRTGKYLSDKPTLLTTHMMPCIKNNDIVRKTMIKFYLKYQWYLRRLEILDSKCVGDHITVVPRSPEYINSSWNVDPISMLMGGPHSVTAVDSKGRRCILVCVSLPKTSGKLHVWYYDETKIDDWTRSLVGIRWSDLPSYRPDPAYRYIEIKV